MREIALTKGLVTIVDDADYPGLARHKWHASGLPGRRYAVRYVRGPQGRRMERMHRVLAGLSPDDKREVDHINRVRLDNRRSNLRVVTHRENGGNCRNQSIFGVGVYRRREKFRAQGYLSGKHVHIGMFDSLEAAAEARSSWLEANHA